MDYWPEHTQHRRVAGIAVCHLLWVGASAEIPRPGVGREFAQGECRAAVVVVLSAARADYFSCLYLVLYPGLGKEPGALEWIQAGELAETQDRWHRKHASVRTRWMQAPLEELAADEAAMRTAWRIYQHNCAACHGTDARGQAHLFPDLLDEEWLWGDSEEPILHTLRAGRQALMPPWAEVLKEEGVAQVSDYVLSLARGGTEDTPGQAIYMQYCAVCHGVEGQGNVLLGAPSLADMTSGYTDQACRSYKLPSPQDAQGSCRPRPVAWMRCRSGCLPPGFPAAQQAQQIRSVPRNKWAMRLCGTI